MSPTQQLESIRSDSSKELFALVDTKAHNVYALLELGQGALQLEARYSMFYK